MALSREEHLEAAEECDARADALLAAATKDHFEARKCQYGTCEIANGLRLKQQTAMGETAAKTHELREMAKLEEQRVRALAADNWEKVQANIDMLRIAAVAHRKMAEGML